MKRVMLLVSALCVAGCEDPREWASKAPGCHYVSCGDLLAFKDDYACGVFVDGRAIEKTTNGQEALAFIKRNGLKTCEVRP